MKEKKLLEIEKQLEGDLIAVYSYEMKQGEIPVFVLGKIDFQKLSEIKDLFKNEKCIIFSHDDLVNGADVFPLKLLHIRNHSTLSLGKDVLKEITLKKADLLKNVELELRTKMVQLREDYLSDSFSVFLDNIKYFIHVINEGVSEIDANLNSDGKVFEDLYTLDGKGRDPLDVVSDVNLYLEDLCTKIDNFTL